MEGIDADVIGHGLGLNDQGVDNQTLIQVNEEIRNHPVEILVDSAWLHDRHEASNLINR